MFLFREKKFLESLRQDVDLELFIPKDEIDFLKEKRKIHQIQNKVNINFFFIIIKCYTNLGYYTTTIW